MARKIFQQFSKIKDDAGETAAAARERIAETYGTARAKGEALAEKGRTVAGEALGTSREAANRALEVGREKANRAYETGSERAREAYQTGREKAVELYADGRDKAGDLYADGREYARELPAKTTDGIQRNPLLALVSATAVGLFAGIMLPKSKR